MERVYSASRRAADRFFAGWRKGDTKLSARSRWRLLPTRGHPRHDAVSAAWSVAFVCLTLVVAVLVLAVAGLYRLVAETSRGEHVPVPEGSVPWRAIELRTGFVVVGTTAQAGFASAVASAARVAEGWQYEFAVVLDESDSRGEAKLREALAPMQVRVYQRSLRALAGDAPRTYFIREYTAQEAASALISPTDVDRHFHAVAGPLLS